MYKNKDRIQNMKIDMLNTTNKQLYMQPPCKNTNMWSKLIWIEDLNNAWTNIIILKCT